MTIGARCIGAPCGALGWRSLTLAIPRLALTVRWATPHFLLAHLDAGVRVRDAGKNDATGQPLMRNRAGAGVTDRRQRPRHRSRLPPSSPHNRVMQEWRALDQWASLVSNYRQAVWVPQALDLLYPDAGYDVDEGEPL